MAILLQLLSPVTGYHPKITVNRSFQPGQTPQVDGYNDINVLTFVSMDILYMAVLLRLFVSKEIGKYLLTPYLLKQPSKSCIMSITPLFIFLLSTSFFCFIFTPGQPLEYSKCSQFGRLIGSFMYLCYHGRMIC